MGRNYFYILHRDIGKEEVLLFWGIMRIWVIGYIEFKFKQLRKGRFVYGKNRKKHK